MMVNDRELLELAARAAGIKYKWEQEGYAYGDVGIVPKGWRRCWNPLTDDSDALQLAVMLCIDISFNELALCVYADECMEPFTRTPDSYAATRRAIVRAAAEIGKRISIV